MKTRLNISFDLAEPGSQGAESAAEAIRSEVVQRGRELAADPTYPNFDLCEKIAGAWLDSQEPEDVGEDTPPVASQAESSRRRF